MTAPRKPQLVSTTRPLHPDHAQVRSHASSHYRTPVVPGQWDDIARRACMNGQCPAFAVALHEVIGGQVVAVITRHPLGEYVLLDWEHVLVRTPGGTLWDAEGPRSDAEVIKAFPLREGERGTVALVDAEPMQVLGRAPIPAHLPNERFLPQNVTVARTFIPAYLQLHDLEPAPSTG